MFNFLVYYRKFTITTTLSQNSITCLVISCKPHIISIGINLLRKFLKEMLTSDAEKVTHIHTID